MHVLTLLFALLASPVPDQPYTRHVTTDEHGRSIRYYLTEESEPLPLLVYVQGSGHSSHFGKRDGQIRGQTGHNTIADVARGRMRLLIVDKPGVDWLDDGREPASDAFRAEHTLDRWCAAIEAAMAAAGDRPDVDASRIAVVGHSEGGLVACRIAAMNEDVTHVAVLAGGGPTQLYDLLVLAREGEIGPETESPQERVSRILRGWDRIQTDPTSTEQFFLGHCYRRWSSFLATSPMEQLPRSDARVFMAQGEHDRAVSRHSFDMLHAHLLAQGRDVTARLVAQANHSFRIEGDGGVVDGWSEIMNDIVSWTLEAPDGAGPESGPRAHSGITPHVPPSGPPRSTRTERAPGRIRTPGT